MNNAIIESAKRIALAVILFLGVVGTGASGWFLLFENSPARVVTRQAGNSSQSATTEFSFSLFKRLAETRMNDDFIFSPLALEVGLLMVRAAASENTKRQITEAVYPGLNENQVADRDAMLHQLLRATDRLTLANRLWVQREFDLTNDYLKYSEKRFGVMPGLVDFKTNPDVALAKINRWTFERMGGEGSRGAFEALLPRGAFDALTQFMVTSAARFKPRWQTQFRADLTERSEFKTSANDKITLRFMHAEGVFLHAEEPDFKLIELPFEGGEFGMLILLPKQLDGLSVVETKLSPESLSLALTKLKERRILLALPRFSFAKTVSLPIVLNTMGMLDAFDPISADFTPLAGRRDLYLSTLIHRALIEVNESGAPPDVQSVAGLMAVPGGRPVVFRADHPFIFLIRHRKTNTIFLMGHLADPKD